MTAAATPPFTITPDILSLAAQIGEAVGRAEAAGTELDLRLRREIRVRTVHGTVAIEGNVLSAEQVSAILDGERVVGPPKDVREAKNANAAYDLAPGWTPSNEADLLKAHEVLMAGLVEKPGRYRSRAAGVIGPEGVHHVGPPADRVPGLMANLFAWLVAAPEHPLITSSVFHYEFEFIHPFEDGNGRLGRLWQSLILARWKPLFGQVPVESVVRERQRQYYKAIEQSSSTGESAPFIRFMLGAILDAVQKAALPTPQETPPVERLLEVLLNEEMTRNELLDALSLRDRKWLREGYLAPAIEAGLIEMTHPEAPTAKYQRYRLTPAGRRVQKGGLTPTALSTAWRPAP